MKQKKGQLRIIAGRWRGRKLDVAQAAGLRPTGDRVRETLFNWISMYLDGAVCWDAFAGSGALGFESLSRGAHCVFFTETQPIALKNLHQSAQSLQAENAIICPQDALRFIANTHQDFDIVFLDPPFDLDLIEPCLELLHKHKRLKPQAIIYLETAQALRLDKLAPDYRLLKEKSTGNVYFYLLQYANQ